MKSIKLKAILLFAAGTLTLAAFYAGTVWKNSPASELKALYDASGDDYAKKRDAFLKKGKESLDAVAEALKKRPNDWLLLALKFRLTEQEKSKAFDEWFISLTGRTYASLITNMWKQDGGSLQNRQRIYPGTPFEGFYRLDVSFMSHAEDCGNKWGKESAFLLLEAAAKNKLPDSARWLLAQGVFFAFLDPYSYLMRKQKLTDYQKLMQTDESLRAILETSRRFSRSKELWSRAAGIEILCYLKKAEDAELLLNALFNDDSFAIRSMVLLVGLETCSTFEEKVLGEKPIFTQEVVRQKLEEWFLKEKNEKVRLAGIERIGSILNAPEDFLKWLLKQKLSAEEKSAVEKELGKLT